MSEFIAHTRTEASVLQCDLTPHFDQSNIFFLQQQFGSASGLQQHIHSPHYENMQRRLTHEMPKPATVHTQCYKVAPIDPDATHIARANRVAELAKEAAAREAAELNTAASEAAAAEAESACDDSSMSPLTVEPVHVTVDSAAGGAVPAEGDARMQRSIHAEINGLNKKHSKEIAVLASCPCLVPS